MLKIAPCLWFNGEAEAAANYYISLFPDSRMLTVSRYGAGARFAEGTALMVEFLLNGQRFQALNGGPEFPMTASISLSIDARDTQEVDHFWDALSSDGGSEGQCGWVTDKFGVSWQVVPSGLADLIAHPDPGKAGRALAAMMQMGKIDMDKISAAAEGDADE